jgi:hypothetical protein
MDNADAVFRSGQVILGSLYPWEGRWYWSGGQADVSGLSEAQLQEACEKLAQQNPRIVYHYDPKRRQAAQGMLDRLHQHFIAYHGDDFVVYPTGQAMTSAQRRRYQDYHQKQLAQAPASTDPEEVAALADGPQFSYPPEVMDHEDGIGLFFNPVDGMEFMIRFNTVISGLSKKGVDLTEDEVRLCTFL